MTDRSPRREPPRRPPFGLECAILYGGIGQVGWLTVLLGVLISWFVLSSADIGFTTYGARLRGVVEDVQATDMTGHGRPILAFSYRFEGPDGRKMTGVSYSTDPGPAAGDVVAIELDWKEPRTSRIEGMRRRPFDAWALLVLLAPLVGVAVVVVGLNRGSRVLSLVRLGRLGTGRVTEVTLVHEDEDGRIYRVVVEHEVAGARHRIVRHAGRTDRIQGSDCAILYEPAAPERSALLDELRGCRVGPDGALVTEDVVAGRAYLVLPVAAVGAVLVSVLAAILAALS